MARGDAARIRQQIGHPILDGDGHWIESLPVLADYLRAVGGAEMAAQYLESQSRDGGWYAATWEERRNRRISRGNWWITTADTTDFASGMLPGLLVERMDEMGIDYAVVYPTRCLGANSVQQEDLRRALCRAYNNMVADIYRPYASRHTPAALMPCFTPEEAIDELNHTVTELGLKVGSFKGSLLRPIAAYARDGESTAGVPYYVDALGIDNPSNYDKLWQHCMDLGVAVTVHQGSSGWVERSAMSNGEFNRVGHAAASHDPLTKALFLGGVVRRFPDLTFFPRRWRGLRRLAAQRPHWRLGEAPLRGDEESPAPHEHRYAKATSLDRPIRLRGRAREGRRSDRIAATQGTHGARD